MPILRRRLICHYCGQRHHKQLPHDGRRFKCVHCEAVNFLDENGDIADVPPDETAAAPQYAHRAESSLTSSTATIETAFCETCLKNQYLFNEALANYLPDPTAANYAQCLAAEPLYRRQLQDRYPQCCARCAPRVEERLRKSTYTAKSDHVRRLLDNTRRAKEANRFGWRSMAVSLAGCAYVLSILVQLLWHFLGAMSIDDANHSMQASDSVGYPKHQHEMYLVPTRVGNWTQPAILLSLLSIWWNPRWQHKISGNLGRLRGLSNYYQAQILLLAIRFASWNMLVTKDFHRIERFRKPAHAMCLAVEVMILAWSLGFAVKVDVTSNVNWQQELAPLVSKSQFVPPTRVDQQASPPPNSQLHSVTSVSFPLGMLGQGDSARRNWQPPTPPDDDYDPDKMELDYQPATFQPRPRPLPKAPEKSPFYGTLPALSQTRSLATKAQPYPPARKAIGLPPGFFDKPRDRVSKAQIQTQRRTVFANPRLKTDELRRDTGLENIFGAVFSLKDEPVNAQDVEMRDEYHPLEDHHASSLTSVQPTPLHITQSLANIVSLISAAALLCSITAIILTDGTSDDFPRLKSIALIIANAVLIFEIVHGAIHIQRISLQYISFIITSSVLAILTAYTLSTSSRLGYKAVASAMCLLVWPEICSALWTDYRDAAGTEVLIDRFLADANDSDQQWEARDEVEPQPSPAWTRVTSDWASGLNQPISRYRASSVETDISSVSAATTSSTGSGWKTPKTSNPRMYGGPSTPGVVSGFGRLGFDDRSIGTSIAGPRARRAR